MKKLTLTGLVAAGVLLTTACSEDNTFQPQPGEGGNVTFTIQLPAEGLDSRAFADGYSATKLNYAVYDAEGNLILQDDGTAGFANDQLTTTVSLSLANGKAYNIAFFAHNDEGAYTFNAGAKTFTVNYAAMTAYNSTDHDAFFALKEVPTVTAPVNQTVTLTRPLAQINWGTNDLAVYNNAYGTEASKLTTKVSIDKVYTTYNMLDGTLTGETDVEFPLLARPENEGFPVTGYEYLSMNYVLVPAESSLVEAVLTPNNGTADLPAVTVANMPVQANYRTNIYGALLTSPADFTVVKEPNFEKPDYDNGYKSVSTAEDLTAAIEAGIPVKLAEDINLEEELSISKDATIDLNGHNLSCDGRVFDCRKNTVLTINDNTGNGKIISNSADEDHTIQSDGKVIINGGTIIKNGYSKDDLNFQSLFVIFGCPDGLEINGGVIGSKDMVGCCVYAEGDITINDGELLNAGSLQTGASLISIGKGTSSITPSTSTLTINGGTFGYEGYGGVIIAGSTYYDVKIHSGKFYGGGSFNISAYLPEEDQEEALEYYKDWIYPLFTYTTPNGSFHYYINGGEFYGSNYLIGSAYKVFDNKSFPDAATITGGQWQVGDLDAYLTDGQTKTEVGEHNGKPVYAVSK